MSGRLIEYNVTAELVTEECCNCGIVFAFPRQFQRQCIDSRGPAGKRFYCPNGHDQYYLGKSDAEKERERAEAAERRAANLSDDLRMETLSHRVTKGRLTRLSNRAKAGICPCCKRQFVALERHMASKHPDFAVEEQSQ